MDIDPGFSGRGPRVWPVARAARGPSACVPAFV